MTDVLTIVREITDDLQACFYTVACEPAISTSSDYMRDLMEAMAEMSNGKYVPLAKANLLPKVIVGSVKQQMMIDALTEKIDEEVEKLRAEYKKENKLNQLTEDVIAEFMEKKWENANLTYKQVAIGTLYRKERDRVNIELLLDRQKCKSLKDFEKHRVKLARLQRSDFRHLETKSSKAKGRKGGGGGGGGGGYGLYAMGKGRRGKKKAAAESRYSSSESEDESDASSDSDGSDTELSISSSEEETTKRKKKKRKAESEDEYEDEKKEEKDKEKEKVRSVGGKKKEKKKKKKKKKKVKKKKNKSKKNGKTIAAARFAVKADDDDVDEAFDGIAIKARVGDDWCDSSSNSSQDVYEEIKPMDAAGVRKAVARWAQTYD